jgi:hypothetical protein
LKKFLNENEQREFTDFTNPKSPIPARVDPEPTIFSSDMMKSDA